MTEQRSYPAWRPLCDMIPGLTYMRRFDGGELLLEYGCDERLHGHWLGRPVPADHMRAAAELLMLDARLYEQAWVELTLAKLRLDGITEGDCPYCRAVALAQEMEG